MICTTKTHVSNKKIAPKAEPKIFIKIFWISPFLIPSRTARFFYKFFASIKESA